MQGIGNECNGQVYRCCGCFIGCLVFITYVLMGDSCGDPLIVVVKTDQVAEDFLQDGGRGEGRERKREREREREREWEGGKGTEREK